MQVHVSAEVSAARAAGRPVVALESTLIAHGLPYPDNLQVAHDLETVVRAAGAVPATVGVIEGVPVIGADDQQLGRLARPEIAKLGLRDLPVAAVKGLDGATTVASTATLAAGAGISVFATGGLGGVHRGADSWDVSADLDTLARTPIVVICAGVKSILDIDATLERLESLGVVVVGYRTTAFPGFYLTDSGRRIDWAVGSAAEIAEIHRAARDLTDSRAAIVVANPIPPGEQLDPQLHHRALSDAMRIADARGIRGKARTPFLLQRLHQATGGASLRVNVGLAQRNTELAAQVAARLCELPPPPDPGPRS